MGKLSANTEPLETPETIGHKMCQPPKVDYEHANVAFKRGHAPLRAYFRFK